MWGSPLGRAQSPGRFSRDDSQPWRVLMLFSETRDLPGNVLLEQGFRTELLAHTTNRIDFFVENLDASRFADPEHQQLFHDYLDKKYGSEHLDLVVTFLGRSYEMASALPESLISNLPVVFVAINQLQLPPELLGNHFSGVVQQPDVQGTIKFIFELQPDTRRVVVIGGNSESDRLILNRVAESARATDGVEFEYWTNRPISELRDDIANLPENTVVLLSSVQRDALGQHYYTSQVAQMLVPFANAPFYVLSAGLLGGGAVGGMVVDLERLGASAAQKAVRIIEGKENARRPVEVRSKGTPMVDWRALKYWKISASRLPEDCIVRYRPATLWDEHKILIVGGLVVLLAQGATIGALLALRATRRGMETQLQDQRIELAHVTRVSTMGQLASALAHELNQPLGAILRNAEAAELFLQRPNPDLAEIRSILADIRRDDQRAGNVIDRMRSLLKRRRLEATRLDLEELISDTIALARPEAALSQSRLEFEMATALPDVLGDRVHLQQVLLNLILNGLYAMKDAPLESRVLKIRAQTQEAGQIEVAVIDRGTGIHPDDLKRVFEPFFTTKPEGMGMGLALTRTIIESHGGRITVQNNKDRGATFTFTLPIPRA